MVLIDDDWSVLEYVIVEVEANGSSDVGKFVITVEAVKHSFDIEMFTVTWR